MPPGLVWYGHVDWTGMFSVYRTEISKIIFRPNCEEIAMILGWLDDSLQSVLRPKFWHTFCNCTFPSNRESWFMKSPFNRTSSLIARRTLMFPLNYDFCSWVCLYSWNPRDCELPVPAPVSDDRAPDELHCLCCRWPAPSTGGNVNVDHGCGPPLGQTGY